MGGFRRPLRLRFVATVEAVHALPRSAAVTVEVDAREYHDPDRTADDELRSDYVVDGELDLDIVGARSGGVEPPRPDPLPRRLCGLCPVCGSD